MDCWQFYAIRQLVCTTPHQRSWPFFFWTDHPDLTMCGTCSTPIRSCSHQPSGLLLCHVSTRCCGMPPLLTLRHHHSTGGSLINMVDLVPALVDQDRGTSVHCPCFYTHVELLCLPMLESEFCPFDQVFEFFFFFNSLSQPSQ